MPTDKQIDAAANMLWRFLDLSGHTEVGVREAARAALTAAEQAEPATAARSGAVKVKPIRWDKHTDIDEWYSYDDGLWGISDYIVYNASCGSDWRLKVRGHTLSDEFASPAEAMDKAQEDHETRILSALEPAEPATDVEPFGYWVKHKYADGGLLRPPAFIPENNHCTEVIALYTHPSPSEARLREALEKLLACPAISDENHNDASWGCPDTAAAISFARAALKEASDERA